MKTTPFQLALKNELTRLERLTSGGVSQPSLLQAVRYARPIKSRGFLLQLFGYRISF